MFMTYLFEIEWNLCNATIRPIVHISTNAVPIIIAGTSSTALIQTEYLAAIVSSPFAQRWATTVTFRIGNHAGTFESLVVNVVVGTFIRAASWQTISRNVVAIARALEARASTSSGADNVILFKFSSITEGVRVRTVCRTLFTREALAAEEQTVPRF